MKLGRKCKKLAAIAVMGVTMLAYSSSAYAGVAYTDPIPGDVNLDTEVDLDDVQLALQAYMDDVVLTGAAFKAADVDKDGEITMQDVQMILQMVMEG